MDEFDWCEKKGRELLEKVLQAGNIKNWWFSEDKHAIWDAIYTTDKVENIVEIKVRKQDYKTYPDWILELKKYNSLKEMAEERQRETDKKVNAYYVNFFNDGYFCFWSIKDVDASTVIQKSCKAKTAINSGYIDKAILPLKIIDSTLFGQLVNNQVTILKYE